MHLRTLLAVVLLPIVPAALGCAAPSGDDEESGSAEGAATATTTATDRHSASSSSKEVWLFAGDDDDVLLGCVNCSSYSSDSIQNAYGTYGSAYGSSTIFNTYGKYGSSYSSTSAWNDYASNPPKLFTKDKKEYFGLFTSNRYKSGRTNLSEAVEVLNKGRDR